MATQNAYAQLDTKHYIPPMFGKEDLGTHYLVLGTPITTPFNVTVTDGTGNLITTIPLSSGASFTYTLGTELSSPFLVSNVQLNTPLSVGKGLILSAAEPFFANVRVKASAQAGSLTSKGEKAALGTEFRTAHMYNNSGYENGKSNCISFMATENNTTVTVSDINPGVIFNGTAGTGNPLTTPDITVTLDAGESYVIAANLNNTSAINNINGLNGTKIISDKNIAVNCGTWLGGNATNGTSPNGSVNQGRDIGIDQIVPKDQVGDEYVLIKGFGVDNERVTIVASEDNTALFLNGSAAPIITLNAGGVYYLDGTDFSANNNLYLKASAPIFVTQTLNGGNGFSDDNERQAGINFLPPVKCTGSKEVTIPNVDFIGSAYISIIADAGANVQVNGNTIGGALSVPGTGDYVTYQVNGYAGDVTVSSDQLVRVSLVNLSGNIGAAGYFSGFSKDINLFAAYNNNGTATTDEVAEGCGNATVIIERSSLNIDQTETVFFDVFGSATEGVDYSSIPNQMTFSPGVAQLTFDVEIFQDALTEGDENVILSLTVDGQLCSSEEIEFTIKDVQPLSAQLNDQSVSCPGEEITVYPTVSGGAEPYEYIWSNGSSADSLIITPNTTTVYNLKVTDVCATDTVETDVTITVPNYNLQVFHSNDTSVLCPYTDLILAAEGNGGLPSYSYDWWVNGQHLSNAATISVNPAVTTDYTIVVTDQCGLETTETVTVAVQTSLMNLTKSEDIVVCPYDTTAIWVDVSGGLPPYSYYWQHSGDTSDQVQVSPGWTTTYTVTVEDACQTYTLDAKPVVEVLQPQANFNILSNTQMENLPVAFDNTSSAASSFWWDLGNGEQSNLFAPSTVYSDDGSYSVTLIATNYLGCSDTLTKLIWIDPEFYFYAPNSFTPNGDALNSVYEVAVIGATAFEFNIYNRWGELIYSTTDPYFKWDGSDDKESLQDGVYIYDCRIVDERDHPHKFTGHITVLK